MDAPAVSVVVPTRGRVGYLQVTLHSLESQDPAAPYELLVVDDGSTDGTRELLGRRGAPSLRLDPSRGLNAARNAGVKATRGELVGFVDDDVGVPSGWLHALMEGAERNPEAEAFGGPIRARFEGPAPRGCGREDPPLTTLDLGPEDRACEVVWGANMLVRRSAFDRIGGFDEQIEGGGDEEEWLERLRAAGGRVVYLAAAGLDHRRAGDDARLRSLVRGAFTRGRGLRAFDARRGRAPGLGRELRVLAGCGWHTVRRACPQGLVMGAHSLGRTVEAVRRH
ncbi:MAG TPA: glycosyltransferase family A protein [Thermoleophilaceae bacterium]|nr:glycosyltransferase family A protein [Thermoleophilaceae bacterium]